jgi:hypothetical protein
MIVSLRREYANLVTSGGQLLLLLVGFHLDSPVGWTACLALTALVSLIAWTSATRRRRAIDDTPTSKVASAAQGYVELKGKGKPLGGMPLLSPLTGLPCLWYRYRIERRSNDKWVYEGGGESDSSFILDDGTGQCLIDPEGAEILATRNDRWVKNNRRYTQWLLIERDPIYALGQFVTKGSVDLRFDFADDLKALLAEWKKDTKSLLARFDMNKDGEVDMKEWELARQQAKRDVAAQHREQHAHAEVSIVHRPHDGRMFLISDLDPSRLARRYRLWSWAHLSIFFATIGGLAHFVRAF